MVANMTDSGPRKEATSDHSIESTIDHIPIWNYEREKFLGHLRDPELAKAIVAFCDNIIGELGRSPYTYNHESRLRIIVAALTSNLGGK